MDLVCTATTPFGTCAVQTAIPLISPAAINFLLTVIVVEENETQENEANVEDAANTLSKDVNKPAASTLFPEDASTPTTSALVFKSPEFQRLSPCSQGLTSDERVNFQSHFKLE